MRPVPNGFVQQLSCRDAPGRSRLVVSSAIQRSAMIIEELWAGVAVGIVAMFVLWLTTLPQSFRHCRPGVSGVHHADHGVGLPQETPALAWQVRSVKCPGSSPNQMARQLSIDSRVRGRYHEMVN
jgi:hypothetical protein